MQSHSNRLTPAPARHPLPPVAGRNRPWPTLVREADTASYPQTRRVRLMALRCVKGGHSGLVFNDIYQGGIGPVIEDRRRLYVTVKGRLVSCPLAWFEPINPDNWPLWPASARIDYALATLPVYRARNRQQ